MKSEFGQSLDHFKRAASLAAQETSSTVGPRVNAARDRVQPVVSQARDAATQAKDAATSGWGSAVATITPLVASAKQGGKDDVKSVKKSAKATRKSAKKVEKRATKALKKQQSSGRKGTLFGLGLIGIAVGVGAAYVLKRRQQAQWDEYDPSPATVEPVGVDDAAFEPDTTAPATIADTTADVRTQR